MWTCRRSWRARSRCPMSARNWPPSMVPHRREWRSLPTSNPEEKPFCGHRTHATCVRWCCATGSKRLTPLFSKGGGVCPVSAMRRQSVGKTYCKHMGHRRNSTISCTRVKRCYQSVKGWRAAGAAVSIVGEVSGMTHDLFPEPTLKRGVVQSRGPVQVDFRSGGHRTGRDVKSFSELARHPRGHSDDKVCPRN